MEQNILLVDDEEAIRMSVGDRLRKEGYMVHYANDAESGLTKATSLPLDVLILDVMLPGRDGLDLCRDVRLAGLSTPILVLSARADTKDKVVGFKTGADAYLTKPFDMLELVARVDALLRRTSINNSSAQGVDAQRRPPRYSKVCKTARTKGERSCIYSIAAPKRDPREELDQQLATPKNSAQLAETVPRLRTMLDQGRLSPQAIQNRGFLSVAQGMVEFLEDILAGKSSTRRCT